MANQRFRWQCSFCSTTLKHPANEERKLLAHGLGETMGAGLASTFAAATGLPLPSETGIARKPTVSFVVVSVAVPRNLAGIVDALGESQI